MVEAAHQNRHNGGEWAALPVTYLEETGPWLHVRSARGRVHAVLVGRRYRMGGRVFTNWWFPVGRAECHVDLGSGARVTLEAVSCSRCVEHITLA